MLLRDCQYFRLIAWARAYNVISRILRETLQRLKNQALEWFVEAMHYISQRSSREPVFTYQSMMSTVELSMYGKR